MFRRIERAVFDLRTHVALAAELSVGLYESISTLVRRRTQLEAAIGSHDARVQRELPGF